MAWIVLIVGITLLAGVVLALYMILIEPRWFRTWRVEIPARADRSDGEVVLECGGIPPLRILHVTDTHFGLKDGPKLDFLSRVAAEDYDFAFLTGDLIETPDGIDSCESFIRQLSPRIGAYAVLGGHDYYHSDDLMDKYATLTEPSPEPFLNASPNPTEQLRGLLESYDLEVLSDENRQVSLPNGEKLALIGLRDAYLFDCNYERAWAGVSSDVPQIVLAHSPDVLGEVCRHDTDLAFFGHTHGGQVRFPLIGALVTRSHLPGERARGVFRRGETVYTLNRGVGAGQRSNFRLLCRPEVTLLQVTQ